MKKYCLLILTFIFFVSLSSAQQWALNGNAIYNTNSGAVRLEGISPFSMNGSGSFEIDAVGTVGGRFVVKPNGNVGIGTFMPSNKLQVAGGAIAIDADQPLRGGGVWLISGNTTQVVVGATNPPGIGLRFDAGAANRMVIDGTSGNVGIGTSAPTYKLDVNGNGRFNTSVDIGGARNPNSASGSLNVYDHTVGDYTNIQFAQSAWGGSNAILFNAYKSGTQVNGDLMASGNVRHANDVGSFSAGSGMIHYLGNGGRMDFFISGNSSGKDTPVSWQTPILSLVRNGNAGIGTMSPLSILHTAGTGANAWVYFNGNLNGASNPQTNAGLAFGWNRSGGGGESIISYADVPGVGSFRRLNFSAWNGTSLVPTLTLFSGNVGIGTESPNQKLTVNGTVYSKEVKVDLNIQGPDYVFEKDYKLASLDEIKSYIDEHKHLPEVPSAKEMEKNGVQLGEMNMLLLKKVEELTLYLIEQNKKLDSQTKLISQQNERIAKLETNRN
ncbi:MAG: hypothetical protein K2U26_14485 [Cyclobacteriaceae bacterium]|nr:hypothetical protein [Cyclobacteriaceae bacterium]